MTKQDVTVWRYVVREPKPLGCWGVFLLDSNGMFAVCSDYGDYAYHWPNQNWGPQGFRGFLAQVDQGYLLSKIAPNRVYSGSQTLKTIRERILYLRRQTHLSRERAREEWDLAEDVNASYAEAFGHWVGETTLDDAYELCCYECDPEAVQFCEHVFRPFVTLLKADLK